MHRTVGGILVALRELVSEPLAPPRRPSREEISQSLEFGLDAVVVEVA